MGNVVEEEVEEKSGDEEEEWVKTAGVGSSYSSCRVITRRPKQTKMYYKIAKKERKVDGGCVCSKI